MKKTILLTSLLFILLLAGCTNQSKVNTNAKNNKSATPASTDTGKAGIGHNLNLGKPVIYLYPQQKQDTTVRLDLKGKIMAEYPEYNEAIRGWEVTAYPDGRLINHGDNQEYSYLFWEGETTDSNNWDISTGFVVKGTETRKFLQETLAKIGLTPKEYNEFIVYWYPLMQNNPYNLIHFAGKEYTDTAVLTISPKPDSILRVFMVFKPLNEKIDIEPQVIQPFERKGFTVVEWGGTELK